MNSNCLILKLLLKVFKKIILEKKSADSKVSQDAKSLGTEISFLSKNYVVRVRTTFHVALCLSAFNCFFGHNFEGKNEKKKSADDKKHAKLPSMQKVSPCTMTQNA